MTDSLGVVPARRALLLSRPIASGVTVPGKVTAFRIGRIPITSGSFKSYSSSRDCGFSLRKMCPIAAGSSSAIWTNQSLPENKKPFKSVAIFYP